MGLCGTNGKVNEAGSTAVDTKSFPSQELLPPRAKRRRFSTAKKNRILALVHACVPGEQGQILRREGIYASQLAIWRARVKVGAPGAGKRGPKPRSHGGLVTSACRALAVPRSFLYRARRARRSSDHPERAHSAPCRPLRRPRFWTA